MKRSRGKGKSTHLYNSPGIKTQNNSGISARDESAHARLRHASARGPSHSAPFRAALPRRSPTPLSLLRPPRPRRWCVNAPDARTRGARDRFVRVARRVGFPARAIGSPRRKTRHAEGPRGVSRGFAATSRTPPAPRRPPARPPRARAASKRARETILTVSDPPLPSLAVAGCLQARPRRLQRPLRQEHPQARARGHPRQGQVQVLQRRSRDARFLHLRGDRLLPPADHPHRHLRRGPRERPHVIARRRRATKETHPPRGGDGPDRRRERMRVAVP